MVFPLAALLALLLLACSSSAAATPDSIAVKKSGGGGGRNSYRKQYYYNNCSSSGNYYEGSWIYDEANYPLYDSSTCPFIRKEFDCLKYGRADRQYLQYRWQPSDVRCTLPRFNGVEFLRRMQGKKIMFIGDSLSLNQYESLLCMVHAAVPNSQFTQQAQPFPTVTFQEYGVSIMLFSSHYLVDIEQDKGGAVLNLNSISSGNLWKQMDVLIFNTWLWWHRKDSKKGWDYIRYGNTISKDTNRNTAYIRGMQTWAKWVDSSVDTRKTRVFFQGVSPSHYNGAFWGKPKVRDCSHEIQPIAGLTPTTTPYGLKVQEIILKTMRKPVHLLNITNMSHLRKDGHPASHNRFHGMDCLHWCVAGVPDTWNQILSTVLLHSR